MLAGVWKSQGSVSATSAAKAGIIVARLTVRLEAAPFQIMARI
jgi:hypothetical protein